MTIKIKNEDFELKYTIRALFIFEQITGKPFKTKTLTDLYIFFYSILLANNPTTTLTIASLIDACDEDNILFVNFNNWLISETKKQNQFENDKDEDNKGSKKKA